MNLTPMIETLSRALDRSAADPVRIDRLTLATLRDTLVDLMRVAPDAPSNLTNTELALYRALAMADGQPVDIEEMIPLVRSRSKAALWVHIRRLRVKLAGTGEHVDTVQRRGYMLRREAP